MATTGIFAAFHTTITSITATIVLARIHVTTPLRTVTIGATATTTGRTMTTTMIIMVRWAMSCWAGRERRARKRRAWKRRARIRRGGIAPRRTRFGPRRAGSGPRTSAGWSAFTTLGARYENSTDVCSFLFGDYATTAASFFVGISTGISVGNIPCDGNRMIEADFRHDARK